MRAEAVRQWLARCFSGAVLFALLASLLQAAGAARAHEMTMAELDLRELSHGTFIWSWGQSGSGQPVSSDLTPLWPPGCSASGQELHCAAPGLVGRLGVDGVGQRYSAAMVRIHWLDGQRRVYAITAGQPGVHLYGAADDERGAREIVVGYTLLGIEHIVSGFDHLLFVLSLLLLVGFKQRLVGTITAFTVAHSLTLASSVLGSMTLRPAPVEALIALSIVLVAAEALRQPVVLASSQRTMQPARQRTMQPARQRTMRPALGQRETLAKRWPALLAFIFGLVHGLGFAGALKDIGLPASHLPLALLTFNIGVEIGQLLMVALAWVVMRLLARYRWFASARTPALYGIGVIAAYWSWLRIAGIVG